MSVSKVVAMRPLPFRSGLGSQLRPFIGVSHCNCRYGGSSLLSISQRRHQSSGGVKQGAQQGAEHQPPTSGTKLLLRALRQSLSLGQLFNNFRGQNLRNLYRQSPEELVIALFLLAGIGCCAAYLAYTYFHYFQSEQFTRLPPEVAKSMRRALYYSYYGPDPKLALKYYKISLEQCEQLNLDPFSDEVMGIKIQLAAWLEKIGSYQNSIDVLEALLRDSQRWIQKMEQTARDGGVDKHGNLIGFPNEPPAASGKPQETSTDAQEPVIENLWGKRRRILARSVGVSVKLGELYADEHVLQSDAAGERLVWAVETVLKELQRRQVQGVKDGEGDWMSPEEIGGAMEALANHYESKSQHYLAAPLYLQALTLSPTKSCHTAVLMNNLAISLAQQPVTAPYDTPAVNGTVDTATATSPTRASLLASARSWALQAHATGSKVIGEDRTEECDEACAVALCNLGEIAAMSGDLAEAKSKFRDALELSKRIGFAPGISQAQNGLTGSSSKPKSKSKA